jgi:hypothetical protein
MVGYDTFVYLVFAIVLAYRITFAVFNRRDQKRSRTR